MPTRTERVEARLAPDQRERIRSAADLSHTSTASFMVSAALERADAVLSLHRLTVVRSDYFDQLFASLDDTTPIPQLERAVESAHDGLAFRRR